ncbi:MAG TPA: Ig-like domain-containing protein, partial [Pirellulaceae bacterium]|nr:Ig-like domain-containing protein [Pirellulaceae bacterium]
MEARFQIAAVNDAPAVTSANFTTTEDMPVALDFTVDDGDPEAIQATVVEVTSLPRHGVLLLSDGTPVTANQLPLSAAPAALRYQPDSNWFGEDRFELVAHDDGGVERDGVDTSLPVTVSLHVAAVNDAPVGGADLYRTGRNHTLVVDATHGVLANDSDVDSAVLSARLIHGPSDGSLTLNPDGSFVFVPNIGFTGSTRFVYRVTDGVTESGDIAVDLVVSTPELEITIGFVDASGRATTQLVAGETGWVEYYVRDISVSARGTFAAYFDSTFNAAVVGLSGPIVYGTTFANAHSGDLATPGLVDELGASDDFRGRGGNRILLARIPLAALSEGSTEFVTDPADTSPEHDSLLWGNSAPLHTDEILFGRATLTVLAPVVAVDDQAALDEDSGASILHVLANDRYSSGLSATITQLTSASNGQVTISADGQSVIYRPAPNYFGADQFTYTLTDSHGTADTAVVSIDVRPVNDPPRAFDDRASVVEDSRDVRIDPLANDDSVPDAAEQLRIIGVSAGDKGGRATIIDGGSAIAYTPAADFFGTETFTYTIADPAGATASATIRVNVDDMNNPPTAGDDSFVFYDSNGAKQLDLLANDSSAPDTGETLRITSVTQPSHGRVTMTADGRRVTFVNDSGFIGDQSFSYMVGDGRGGTAQATVFVSTVHYWQNSRNPLDVNADLFVSPIDALLVINYLNSHGAGPLPLPPD